MSKELLRVSAPGKVILHGEHSVVYGKTALAVSVDLRTTVKIFNTALKNNVGPALDNNLEIHMTDVQESYTFPLSRLIKVRFPASNEIHTSNVPCLKASSLEKCMPDDEEILHRIQHLILEMYSDISEGSKVGLVALLYLYLHMVVRSWAEEDKLEPLLIEISSQIPIGAGLGSSAAFSVAIAGAFYYYCNNIQNITHEDTMGSFKYQDQGALINRQTKGESFSPQHLPINSAEKPIVQLIENAGNDNNNSESPSSKSSSGCISTCSSSPPLSPPTTPPSGKRVRLSSDENMPNNDTDDEENAFRNEGSTKFNTSKDEYDCICRWAFLAEKVIHGNPSGKI